MKMLPVFFSIIIILSACKGSADKKVPEFASEMCGCFDSFKQSITPEEMNIFKEVSVAEYPQEVLQNAIKKMDGSKAAAFTEKIKSVGEKTSPVYVCIQEFDKKHVKETTQDKKALTEKLFAQLQANNCIIGAAIINLSLKSGK
jgi:hypothetical protein